MADEQKTEQEQQPVETKVEETVEAKTDEEKVYNLKQKDLENLIQKRIDTVTRKLSNSYKGFACTLEYLINMQGVLKCRLEICLESINVQVGIFRKLIVKNV